MMRVGKNDDSYDSEEEAINIRKSESENERMRRIRARMEKMDESSDEELSEEGEELSGDEDEGLSEDEDSGEIQKSRLKKQSRSKDEKDSYNDSESESESDAEGDSASDSDSNSDSDSDSSEEELSDEEATLEELRVALREMPMAQLAKLKKNGIKGEPLHKVLHLPGPQFISAWINGDDFTGETPQSTTSTSTRTTTQKPKKRKKNAPTELSSKTEVSRFRYVVPVKERKVRDPRFDDLSGKLDEHVFEKRFGFIDEMRKKEIEDLDAALKRNKKHKFKTAKQRKRTGVRMLNEEEEHEAMAQLTKLRQARSQTQRLKNDREISSELRRKEKELIAQGKRPHHATRGEKRKLLLERQFEQLEATGKLDKYMEKRRKKIASKERKLLPNL